MLLDTSGLLCLIDESDDRHEMAAALNADAVTRITTSYILAELVPLCHKRGIPRGGALAFASALLDSADVQVVWIEEQYHREGMELLQARQDKAYSLCDAISFLVMRELDETEALTTDRHFEQEGFVRLLPN